MGYDKQLFKGKINGKNVYEIKKQINYKEQKLEDRKNIVENILNDKDENGLNFFENYFDNYYKAELNQNDSLSENNNVCKTLEQMADYLLGSTEVREERKSNGYEYRFFIDKNEFNKVLKREESLDNKCSIVKEKSGSDNSDQVINFLLKKRNYYKPKKQTINEDDLKEDSFCGEVLRAYKVYDDFLKEKLNQPNNGQGYKLRKTKGEVAADMIYTKDTLNGVFGYHLKNQLFGTTVPSWEYFDWSDVNQVRLLVYINKEFDPSDDLSFMVFDLNQLIEKMKKDNIFVDKELIVYKMIKQGYKNVEIASILKLNRSSISNIIYGFSKKISDYAVKMGY